MEGIDSAEKQGMSDFKQELDAQNNWEVTSSMLFDHRQFYEDLRVAARNSALVTLVTRLHHWLTAYARRLSLNRQPKSLVKEMSFLNTAVGNGPVLIAFFKALVDVRDSVIHADSKPEWSHDGTPRGVLPQYRTWRVEVTEEDLTAAIEKAIEQVMWYDKKLQAIGK
jgi:hypothetical protein